ncbi:MAG: glycosyltransferase family 2 protein [Prevotella sp.]
MELNMSNNQPLVSVIIPNYNHARFLDERMQSVLGQTYQNIEVIILDDCSTDNSREVIEKYRNHPKVADIVYNDKNSGSPFRQWKKGMELVTGNIVWIAESDDHCETTFLEELLKPLTEHDDAFCFCRSMKVDEDDKEFELCQQTLPDSRHWADGKAFIREEMLSTTIVLNASSAIFRRNLGLKAVESCLDFHGAGDWLFFIRLAEMGGVGFIGKNLNHFRQFRTSTTSIQGVNGNAFVENYRVFDYLKRHHYMTLCQSLRIAYFSMYQMVYDNPQMGPKARRKALKAWHCNWFIMLIIKASHKYFQLRTM